MINKRLIRMAPDSKKHIGRNILLQMLSLTANIVIMFVLGFLIQGLVAGTVQNRDFMVATLLMLVALVLKIVCTRKAIYQSYMASKSVKRILREKIYQKLLKLGSSYSEKVSTAEVVQASVEGVEQLEIYFGSYLPQFFYSLLAPVVLFAVLAPISFVSALVLFLCVPLIPLSIILVQKFAKRLLAKYWGQYVKLGNSFLENLQGLTTLKIYQSDEYKHQEMNKEAEHFRRITMKVLTMQLNSITIMDWIAYGGAALGIIMAVREFAAGHIGVMGCFVIIMLSADFFLPLRLLGSFFHVAMNGMAASEKIFRLLDLPEDEVQSGIIEDTNIVLRNLSYSYDNQRTVVRQVSMEIPATGFTAIVGESGCGKSTIAGILSGENRQYTGSAQIGSLELNSVNQTNLKENITLIGIRSYIFKGTVRENLLMARPEATEAEMWAALAKVNLADFLKTENGLETVLTEKGENFSGGQKQRLAVARALLHDSQIYIFDEATSNIDVESENDILQLLHELAKDKSIVLISHRLANVVKADRIYVMANGDLKESGRHEDLLQKQAVYANLWNAQMNLEKYRGGIIHETADCN
ncbi:ABC transporter ATP-binding protein/permease [Clostridiales bacterium COT073_COT-073]|nr:ABC transporter ATP-binding protein/permease [Clostridiales bacterium COT073_COT-073]